MWFRTDLRLADNPALAVAAERPLVALYVLDDGANGARPLGGAARWWLARSLRALAAALAAQGVPLILRRGAAAEAVPAVLRETGAGLLAFNPGETPIDRAAEGAVTAAVAKSLPHVAVSHGVRRSALIHDPASVGGRVFTPFWKHIRAAFVPPPPLPAPDRLAGAAAVRSDALNDWELEPTAPDWAGGLDESWAPGEAGAAKRLADFLDGGLTGYATLRDRPDLDHVSRLSPHLRFGEITPAQLWHAARAAMASGRATSLDVEKFLTELGWREFSYNLLNQRPLLAEANIQPRFDAFPWRQDEASLAAWQRGLTGYPIVDAGMRQLWQTGWMHNRVRMVVASFLVKHLLQDWRAGEAWFWDTLVDADPASNPASWQWVAGCGADAAPYFRIFNPVLQGEKFDPHGDYVRRWVPELTDLPNAVLHRPWTAPPGVLSAAGVTLGESYPAPLVDHAHARARALAAFQTIKAKAA
ncbi:deoxyribodipyrimidine photolyase [Blastochloris viridis]|nr:deoxyribodipyrimidine photolyase [Blastochloris viridis]